MPVAVLFLFPEINVRYFAQNRVVRKFEKPFGKSKSLQQIQSIKRDSACHKRNGFKTILIIGKITDVRTRKKTDRNRSLQKIRNMKNRGDQISSKVLKTIGIAKMDASKPSKYNISGQYWLVPAVAKMDAVKIFIASVPVNSA